MILIKKLLHTTLPIYYYGVEDLYGKKCFYCYIKPYKMRIEYFSATNILPDNTKLEPLTQNH